MMLSAPTMQVSVSTPRSGMESQYGDADSTTSVGWWISTTVTEISSEDALYGSGGRGSRGTRPARTRAPDGQGRKG